jgi:outer membrane receptor for monomeric catechols
VAPNQRKYNVRYLTNYAFASDAFNGRLRGVSLGGSARWESKGAAGYLGKVGDPNVPDLLNVSDITKPVYFDNGRFYTDVWVSYSRKLFSDRINMKLQLNVENVFEDGRLEPVAVNFDGQPWAYRIIDPRKFILTATFGF